MADNSTLLEKLDGLVARFEEVSTLITDPAVIADQKRYVKLTKEYKELGDLMNARKEYMLVLGGIEEAKEIIVNETDPEMREMAREELDTCQSYYLFLPIRKTAVMQFLKFVEVRGEMKLPYLQVTSSACIPNIVKQKVGKWKFPVPMKVQLAVSRK